MNNGAPAEFAILHAGALAPLLLFGWIARTRWKRRWPLGRLGCAPGHGASVASWIAVLMGVLLVAGCGGASQDGSPSEQRLPAFPWPPPAASAETAIPDNWLPPKGEDTTIGAVASSLERALEAAGYPKWRYSSVPDGFALVTQMEQIKSDGTPSQGPSRWSTDLPSVRDLNLIEFIRALAGAQPGYYRVIVFIVTDQPWAGTGEEPSGADAERWMAEGLSWLPPSISELPYGPHSRTTALIYEFGKTSSDEDATLLEPSATSAHDHLEGAGITDWLSRR